MLDGICAFSVHFLGKVSGDFVPFFIEGNCFEEVISCDADEGPLFGRVLQLEVTLTIGLKRTWDCKRQSIVIIFL